MPICITGGAVRAIYCFIVANYNEDDASMYKKRAKNAIKFAIMASLVEAVKQLAEYYFYGGKSI
jgi:hypothetical protein